MDRSYQTLDEVTKKLWEPSNSAVVCKQHFTPDDYVSETIQGQRPLSERLKNTAVLSVFSWKKEVPDTTSRAARAERRFSLKRKFDEISKNELETSFATDCQEETVTSEDQKFSNAETNTAPVLQSTFTQTDEQLMFSVENFEKDDEAIHCYTGLESYAKFLVILQSLGPSVFSLNYVFFQIQGLSVQNQFFMTLIKLRRYTPHFELSRFFSISENSVKNIVFTWILFMYKQWKEVSIWPPQSLVRYFTPSDFKQKFPSTRAIMDATEFPIKKPSAPRAQQATFSTYKNRNTMKSLIGCTPGGLINFISPAYCGSTSDRQIVERSQLKNMCDPGDSLMADKGYSARYFCITRCNNKYSDFF